MKNYNFFGENYNMSELYFECLQVSTELIQAIFQDIFNVIQP